MIDSFDLGSMYREVRFPESGHPNDESLAKSFWSKAEELY
jgi:hypothetical protein